jgi:c-di-GMP-binding flagellar brake protein YcgR
MSGRSYVEKREYPRMSIKADITYKIDGNGATYTGISNNLSHAGIQFITERALSPGKAIEFMLPSYDGKVDPLEAKVKVLRVKPTDNKYIVAGKIIEYK